MIPAHKIAVIVLAALAGVGAAAFTIHAQLQGQTVASRPQSAPPPWAINRSLVVLDPAHGGSDSGATLGDVVAEKDITLAIASKLKVALQANGFSVVSTRDADGDDLLSTDQRAETANRTHAMACIVLHATATGSGVHVYTSRLQPPAPNADAETPSAYVPVPWDTAQAAFVRQSLDLAGLLNTTLDKNHLPALVGQVPVRPLDNLMCPAVAIEVSPLLAPGVAATPVTDANYQQQVANALAVALRAWHDSPDLSTPAQSPPSGQTAAQVKAIAAAQAVAHTASKVHTPTAAPGSHPPTKGPQ